MPSQPRFSGGCEALVDGVGMVCISLAFIFLAPLIIILLSISALILFSQKKKI